MRRESVHVWVHTGECDPCMASKDGGLSKRLKCLDWISCGTSGIGACVKLLSEGSIRPQLESIRPLAADMISLLSDRIGTVLMIKRPYLLLMRQGSHSIPPSE